MKKTLLFVSLCTFGASFAQDCSKIFISEYVEGWSNNKAVEIYNPTSSPVDLSQYIIARYSNGSNAATVANAIQLTGTVGAHDVYVAVLDKRDPNGTGQEAPVWDSLQAKADGFYAPIYADNNSFYWNGNDCVILFQGTLSGAANTQLSTLPLTVIDVFGKRGEDPGPGTGWSTAFPYNTGLGVVVTADHSLIRKPTVMQGVTNLGISFFDPLAEYDSIPAVTYLFDNNGDTVVSGNGNPILFGNWFSLGSHTCNCGNASLTTIEPKPEFNLFPNPSNDGLFFVEANSGIESIVVFNSLGQQIKNQKFNSDSASFKINDLPGVYIVRVQTGNAVVSKRVVVK